uniref:PDZ domain-containing protein n=1 Tax=Globisporangium ultimum (strain ATCC 200006 / CBS 805.95 / DAOM BR144) TaxID=431595 RepID=K3W6B7_GLOUD
MSTKRMAHQVSATPSPRSHLAIDVVEEEEARVATTPDCMPRTTEILWNGTASLGFTLKRKRKTGAILVSKVKDAAGTPQLRIGSELKLVGGFPVQKLTLDEVKKVMLHAPKPVSLVFLNKDKTESTMMTMPTARQEDAVFITDCSERGSFDNEFEDAPTPFVLPMAARECDEVARPATRLQRSSSAFGSFAHTTPCRRGSFAMTAPTESFSPTSSSGFTTYSNNYYAKPTDSKAKKRKVSKLRVALDRMSQLLNRPVRQSALNIPAGKSIVVQDSRCAKCAYAWTWMCSILSNSSRSIQPLALMSAWRKHRWVSLRNECVGALRYSAKGARRARSSSESCPSLFSSSSSKIVVTSAFHCSGACA